MEHVHRFYRLTADDQPVLELDRQAWADWIVDPAHRAALHVAVNDTPLSRISTMFVGFEDDESQGPEPLVWETRVDHGPLDGLRERYPDRAQAHLGHHLIVTRVREAEQRLNGCSPN